MASHQQPHHYFIKPYFQFIGYLSNSCSKNYKISVCHQSDVHNFKKPRLNHFFVLIMAILFLQLFQPSYVFAANKQVKALKTNASTKKLKHQPVKSLQTVTTNKKIRKAIVADNKNKAVRAVKVNSKQADLVKRRFIKPAVARKTAKPSRIIVVSQRTAQSSSKHSRKISQIKSLVSNKKSNRLGHRVQIKTYAQSSIRFAKSPMTKRVAFSPSSYKSNIQPQVYRSTTRFNDQADGRLTLRSNIAYVFDQNSRQALIDKNSRAVVPIASITKLMTAIVVLESGMPLDDLLMVTNDDLDYEKWTRSRLAVGSKLTRNDMLHIALMASENRAASALSRYYAGGKPAFIKAMNQKAHDLGMAHTFFKNATGLSSQNISSAQDLVKLVEEAYRFPLIREYSTDTAYTVNTGLTTLHYGSTNGLVKNSDWEIGVQKTGFINEAGECLVMQIMIDSKPIIMVLLDADEKYSRISDAKRLRHWIVASQNIRHTYN